MPRKDPEARRAYNHERYLTKRDAIRQQHREYYENHREEARVQRRRWYEAHREEVLAQQRAYRLAHPEEIRERKRVGRLRYLKRRRAQGKAYYWANRDTLLAKSKIYRETHKEQLQAAHQAHYPIVRQHRLAYMRLYNKSHPLVNATNQAQRRARKAQDPLNDFTTAQWREMQAAYDHRCSYCGNRAKGHLTQDHLTPLSKGGHHTAMNIVPACRSCNSSKGTGPAKKPVQPLLLTMAPKRRKPK